LSGLQGLQLSVDSVFEIRWHGRGGQGAVTSAEIVALAAISEGKYAQAFPSFGPERRGAPVLAFNRVSTTGHIRVRAPILSPDVVVVLDPGLPYVTDVTSGLKADGVLVVNTSKRPEEVEERLGGSWRLAVVDATAIARQVLGVPIVNTTMLGALIKATALVRLESLIEPIEERFGARAKSNIEASRIAFEATKIVEPKAGFRPVPPVFKEEKLPSWRELLAGCVVVEPGNAKSYRTGDWRSDRPIWNRDRCIKCGICFLFCPEGCVRQDRDGYFEADLYYCKGCGICACECWTQAITMVEES